MAQHELLVGNGASLVVVGGLLGILSCQGNTDAVGNGADSETTEEDSTTADGADTDVDSDSDVDEEDTDVLPNFPTVPENVTVIEVNAYSTGITWVASQDDVEIVGYHVYRDGNLIDSIDEPPYNDNSGLSPGTVYNYTVSSYDEDGNESLQSPPVSSTTLVEPLTINPSSEVVPEYALADWSGAGVENGIPNYSVGTNVMDYGAVGDGLADDTEAILEAIEACQVNSAVFFPEGVYFTTSTINVSKAIVLRGAGPDETVVRQSHSGTGIHLREGANYAGIEDMHVETVYPFDEAGGRKILLENVENSWVRNIEASGYTYHQVSIVDSSHCEVRDSYIHNSYEKAVVDNYGTFYGVEVAGHHYEANYNLVENNVLDWFSSALILQHKAHYNVYAYNFSWNVWSENAEGVGYSRTSDFELHHYDYDGTPSSHFIYYLLSEGNVFEQAGNPNNYHRKNTFFRNKINNGGITLRYDNVAFGNEFVAKKNPGTWNPGIADDNSVRSIQGDSISHGNYITVPEPGMVWDSEIDDHVIPDSFYLESKPAFFGDLPWPSYGGDMMPGNTKRSPAEVRYWSTMYPEEAPSDLDVVVDGNEVSLTWNNNSSNDVDFIICRSNEKGKYERIGMTTGTVYTDVLSDSGQYSYYVRTVNHLGGRNHLGELRGSDLGGESEPSNIVETNYNL